MASFFSSAGSFLITVLASVFVFGIVIFIHELGHFLTAKFSGIQVNEFALGMGPTLFSFTRGGTKYGLRLFPIGGFVSMEGEDEESEEAGSFTKAPVGNRILVTVAGAVMNVNQLVIDFKVLGEKKTVGSVLKEAGNWTLSLGRMVVLSLTDLITGRIAVNNLSGPVGIVSAISEASSLGLSSLLMLLALITINLGIFLTFCPFPRWTADGWYSLSSRRSAENPSAKKYEIAINAAGFILLIGLMIFCHIQRYHSGRWKSCCSAEHAQCAHS